MSDRGEKFTASTEWSEEDIAKCNRIVDWLVDFTEQNPDIVQEHMLMVLGDYVGFMIAKHPELKDLFSLPYDAAIERNKKEEKND